MDNRFRNVIIACVLLSPAAVICQSQAAGQITFTGKVIDEACTVVINGGTQTVELGDTVAADLATAGQTGAPKQFTVALTACPAAAEGVPTKAYIKFSGTTDGDETYFKNDVATDGATNVAVMLKDANDTAVVNNDGNSAILLPEAGGDVDVNYTAMLVATADKATSGDVSTTLTYNVSYE